MDTGLGMEQVAQKQRIRTEIRAARLARAEVSAAGSHARTLQHLVEQTGAARITSFISVAGEPDTSEFHRWARDAGIEVLLPCVLESGEMEWALLDDDPLLPRAFGIPEPTGARLPADAPAHADLMLIPAAAVDTAGNRLGWGRGFFDRSLAAIAAFGAGPRVFAVVFDTEVFDAGVDPLPTEPHDAPVNGVVTESRLLWVEANRGAEPAAPSGAR